MRRRAGSGWLVVAWLLFAAVEYLALSAAAGIRYSDSLERTFESAAPAYRHYRRTVDEYGSTETDILLLFRAETLADADRLRAIEDVLIEIQFVAPVAAVLSPFSVTVDGPQGDELLLPAPEGADLEARLRRAREDRPGLRRLLADPGDVLLGGAGIDDETEVFGAAAVDDQIVDHAALRVEHAAVHRAAVGDAADVIGQQATQETFRLRPLQVDGAHVRDVEEPGAAAHGMVFLELAAVMQGHLPAGEIHHPAAGVDMGLEQYGVLGHGEGPAMKRSRRPSVLAPESVNPFGVPARGPVALQSRLHSRGEAPGRGTGA